jgi:hypothetical protein
MDILIISFMGILLMSGMCSGLMLNIYRKLKEDKAFVMQKNSSPSGNSGGGGAGGGSQDDIDQQQQVVVVTMGSSKGGEDLRIMPRNDDGGVSWDCFLFG